MLALVKCMIMLLVACWGFVSQLLRPTPSHDTSPHLTTPPTTPCSSHCSSTHLHCPKFSFTHFVFIAILENWMCVWVRATSVLLSLPSLPTTPSLSLLPLHAHPVHTCVTQIFENFQQSLRCFFSFHESNYAVNGGNLHLYLQIVRNFHIRDNI